MPVSHGGVERVITSDCSSQTASTRASFTDLFHTSTTGIMDDLPRHQLFRNGVETKLCTFSVVVDGCGHNASQLTLRVTPILRLVTGGGQPRIAPGDRREPGDHEAKISRPRRGRTKSQRLKMGPLRGPHSSFISPWFLAVTQLVLPVQSEVEGGYSLYASFGDTLDFLTLNKKSRVVCRFLCYSIP